MNVEIQDCRMFLFKSANDFTLSLNVLMFCCVASIVVNIIWFCMDVTFTNSSDVSSITCNIGVGIFDAIPTFLTNSLTY